MNPMVRHSLLRVIPTNAFLDGHPGERKRNTRGRAKHDGQGETRRVERNPTQSETQRKAKREVS
jgi:hypothetical protein